MSDTSAKFPVAKPAVPRHWLFVIAGCAWAMAGIVLCLRAYLWFSAFQANAEVIWAGIGIVLAVAFYIFLFSIVVRKNIARICTLPDHPCAFAFTAWRGYIIIGVMMTIGITLRNSSLPKEFLAPPYTAMGGALLFGSYKFFSQFYRMARLKQPCFPSKVLP